MPFLLLYLYSLTSFDIFLKGASLRKIPQEDAEYIAVNELLVFEVDHLHCPKSQGLKVIIGFIDDGVVIREILKQLGL